MDEQKNAEKIMELIKNKNFLLKLSEVKTDEEAMQLFANNNAEVNDEQIKTIISALKGAMEENKKLADKELEKVSGGGFFTVKQALALTMGITLIAGTAYMADDVYKKYQQEENSPLSGSGLTGKSATRKLEEHKGLSIPSTVSYAIVDWIREK